MMSKELKEKLKECVKFLIMMSGENSMITSFDELGEFIAKVEVTDYTSRNVYYLYAGYDEMGESLVVCNDYDEKLKIDATGYVF